MERVYYNKLTRAQVRANIKAQGLTIIEDCIHFNGTYFLVDKPKRNLEAEIDILKSKIAILETKSVI